MMCRTAADVRTKYICCATSNELLYGIKLTNYCMFYGFYIAKSLSLKFQTNELHYRGLLFFKRSQVWLICKHHSLPLLVREFKDLVCSH